MSEKHELQPCLAVFLEALTRPQDELDADVHDYDKLQQVCSMIEDVGPEPLEEDAARVVAGLVKANPRLWRRFSRMLEDARTFGTLSHRPGVTVYECRCIRGLLVGLVAVYDAGVAARVASEREIPWPDAELWPRGVPATPGAAVATILNDGDEEKVGTLGLAWLDAGILPAALDPKVRPVLQILIDAGEEIARLEAEGGEDVSAPPPGRGVEERRHARANPA